MIGNPHPPASAPESPQDDGMPAGVYWLALLTGFLVAGLGAKSVLQDYRLIHKVSHWEEEYRPIPARILRVGVRQDVSEAKDKFYPDVLFEYFPDGKNVWGWRYSCEEEPKPKAYWEDRLRSYRIGDTITARVSRFDPRDAFIEPRWDGMARVYLKAMLGIGFVAVGLWLCWIPAARWIRSFFT